MEPRCPFAAPGVPVQTRLLRRVSCGTVKSHLLLWSSNCYFEGPPVPVESSLLWKSPTCPCGVPLGYCVAPSDTVEPSCVSEAPLGSVIPHLPLGLVKPPLSLWNFTRLCGAPAVPVESHVLL